MLALARAGILWVPINPQAVGDSLAYVLQHAEPRLIIAEADLLPAIGASGVKLGERLLEAEAARRAAANLPAKELGPPPAADAPFAIMYTSRHDRRPKGVIVSHRMLRLSGEAAALVAAPGPGDAFYVWEPLFHIGGAQLLGAAADLARCGWRWRKGFARAPSGRRPRGASHPHPFSSAASCKSC
jgi:crotonobetaine/carnitine-CoA ligase